MLLALLELLEDSGEVCPQRVYSRLEEARGDSLIAVHGQDEALPQTRDADHGPFHTQHVELHVLVFLAYVRPEGRRESTERRIGHPWPGRLTADDAALTRHEHDPQDSIAQTTLEKLWDTPGLEHTQRLPTVTLTTSAMIYDRCLG